MLSDSDYHSSTVIQLIELLLQEFEFWFGFLAPFLETQSGSSLSQSEQTHLSAEVKQAWYEVKAAQTLLQASDWQAGVELSLMIQWYHLLFKIWQIIDDTTSNSFHSTEHSPAVFLPIFARVTQG
jgi:hypothetical protein